MSFSGAVLDELRVIPCLSSLREQDLSVITEISTVRNIPKNSMLFLEAEPVESFFIVRSGAIRLFKSSEEGRELTVRVMKEGDYFCCAPIYGSGKYYVNAVTLEDSVLITIPADDFKRLFMGGMSEIGMKMIASLCARIRFLSNLVEDLTFKDVEQRVVVALLRLAEEKMGEGNLVTLSLTHQDIASLIGTVREVVSRVMLKLKREKIIVESSIKGFTIDKARLIQYLERR